MDNIHHKYLDDLLDYIITKDNDNENIRTSFMPPDDLGGLRYEKLIRDKYIMQYGQDYRATIEGRIFFEKGGYIGEKRRQTISVILQSIVTGLIAIGTIGLLILEWQKYHADCLCK